MSPSHIFQTWFVSILMVIFNSAGFSAGDFQSNAEQSTSPTGTVIFNLPIVEQNAPTSTPIPAEIYPAPEVGTEIPPGTPTPTPIPVQTGAVNLPIVIGALAIIVVILFAWFFVGYLPSKVKRDPN